jgi:hypothetical protein
MLYLWSGFEYKYRKTVFRRTGDTNRRKRRFMILSQKKKGLYRFAGLLLFLIFGLLCPAGVGPPGSWPARPESHRPDATPAVLAESTAWIARPIAALVAGEAHAAEDSSPALVRKKLPTVPPAAASAVAAPSTVPAPAVTDPPKAATETPPAATPPDAAPPARAAMPELAPAPAPSPAPPAKTEPPQPEIKPLSGARGAYPFSILLSSCKEKPSAVTALSGYRKTGLTAYIVETDLGAKGLWWRILAGSYRTLDEAAQARKALRFSDAVVVKTPYANLIGQYASEKEAFQAADRLGSKDVFPYVVRTSGNSFQLLAGAFPSQQGAEKHQRELESKGVAAHTIQR